MTSSIRPAQESTWVQLGKSGAVAATSAQRAAALLAQLRGLTAVTSAALEWLQDGAAAAAAAALPALQHLSTDGAEITPCMAQVLLLLRPLPLFAGLIPRVQAENAPERTHSFQAPVFAVSGA